MMIDASLAQLVEHDTLNVGVQGSSPWGSTKGEDLCNLRLFLYSMPGATLWNCWLSVSLDITCESDGIVEDYVGRSEAWLWKHGGMPVLVSCRMFRLCWIFNGIEG